MQFIKPHEISGKILTLIEEAREELIIVSPYVKIREWNKMIKALQKAVQKGVNVIFIARLNCKQDLSILDDLDIKPILIMDLHAKVYINESSAVVTSHNLYYYSDTNSIELGHFTEDVKEIKELKKFVDVYLLDKPVNTVKFSERKKYELKEDFEFLKQWEVEKLKDFFEDKYPNKKITSTSSYIFSDDILGFCDLMISGSFTIKFWKNNTDDSIIERMEKISFPELNYKYKAEKNTSNPKYIYFEFIPLKKYAREKYFEDFYRIAETLKVNRNKLTK